MGLRPLLAGCNAARLRAVGDESGFECHVVDLADGKAAAIRTSRGMPRWSRSRRRSGSLAESG